MAEVYKAERFKARRAPLVHGERLYALRCLQRSGGGTPAKIGIAKSALDLLVVEGVAACNNGRYEITCEGDIFIEQNGGGFSHIP